MPLWIDLKQYAEERGGLTQVLRVWSRATYGLDAREVEKHLVSGDAALYLDGLDEIFDGPTRGAVIEEIAAFAARYSQASVIVTSRIVGYEAERLQNAGFTHATLEDFDNEQISDVPDQVARSGGRNHNGAHPATASTRPRTRGVPRRP